MSYCRTHPIRDCFPAGEDWRQQDTMTASHPTPRANKTDAGLIRDVRRLRKSSMNHRALAIAALIAFTLVSSSWAYISWAGGSVISSVSGDGGYSFKVRQIPLHPPGLNDGYAYRCEVWRGRILVQASTYAQDSWTARTVSITPGSDQVVFHVEGYNIACRPFGISADGVWSGGGHE